jgi:hypothetical protein
MNPTGFNKSALISYIELTLIKQNGFNKRNPLCDWI